MLRERARGVVLLAVVSLFSFPAAGQQEQMEGARKVVNKVVPAYPDLARRIQLRGMVKVEVQVAPDGTVKATKVLGGSPLLAAAAVDAVRRWKYAPSTVETTNLVELKFSPN